MLSLGTWRYGAGALYAAILGSGLVAAAEKPKAAGIDPLFTGTVLPVPPQQGRPWTAPAVKLSAEWMDGVRFLVGRGYADPRGCEYRDVRLAFGGQTHAWVIPQGRGERADNARFAVSWDGSVYPVMKIGAPPASRTTLRLSCSTRPDISGDGNAAVGGSFDDATGFGSGGLQDMEVWVGGIARSAEGCSETELVSHSSLLGLKSCTLMLLGEATLAERAWNTWINQGGAEHWGKPTTRTDDRILAEEWAWAPFLRAVDAHRRGDDAIATHDAKSLIQLWKGEPSHSFFRNSAAADRRGRGVAFAGATCKSCSGEEFRKTSDSSQRITALLRNLEVADLGDSPGLGMLTSPPWDAGAEMSPAVQALVKEGLPAIEPLLKCLASHQHLTRIDQFTGISRRHGFYIVTTDQASFTALQGIFKIKTFGSMTKAAMIRHRKNMLVLNTAARLPRKSGSFGSRIGGQRGRKSGSQCLPMRGPRRHNGWSDRRCDR